jgi:internalin A
MQNWICPFDDVSNHPEATSCAFCQRPRILPRQELQMTAVESSLAKLPFDWVEWWLDLPNDWKMIFRQILSIHGDLTQKDLLYIATLQEVFLGGTSIHTIHPLSKIQYLEMVDLSFTPIIDLSPLADLPWLQRLWINRTGILSLEPLRGHRHLLKIWCDENQLTSLEPLGTCQNLMEIHAGFNPLTDISTLANLQTLTFVSIHDTSIRSLEPLATSAPKLQTLYCYNARIDSLEPLRQAYNLRTLHCGNNPIKTLRPIMELDNLEEVAVWNTAIPRIEIDEFKSRHPRTKIYRYQEDIDFLDGLLKIRDNTYKPRLRTF